MDSGPANQASYQPARPQAQLGLIPVSQALDPASQPTGPANKREGWTDGWTDNWMGRRTDRWMDRGADGQMFRRMDGRMNGHRELLLILQDLELLPCLQKKDLGQ